MKKFTFLLTLVLGLFINTNTFSATVSYKHAELVAKNFISEVSMLYHNQHIDYRNIKLELIDVKKDKNGQPYYYTFNVIPKGFIIVSAETAFNPILGYSLDDYLDLENENPVFNRWMNFYTGYIDFIRTNKHNPTQEMEKRWKKYNTENFDFSKSVPRDNIDPLLTNTWNQDYPYNYYCPIDEDGPGDRVYAGCVATAMSMIMYHYKYPLQGQGTHTYYDYPYGNQTANYGETEYNWDAMDDYITISSNETSILAVAELQRHCGVAVNMGYSAEGSGAYSSNVPNAVNNYFKYTNAQYIEKDYYSASEWNNTITEQLENGHPIYYSGYSNDGGHAFCLDGKQGDDMFHFNFGWSGSGNGFFYLEGNGAVGGFNYSQGAVINFYPPTSDYPYEFDLKTINTGGGGVISDYSMPYEPYNADSEYRWLIVPESEKDSVTRYDFTLLSLNLEEGDYLSLYDGDSEEDPIIGHYTGIEIPSGSIKSNNDTVLVVFSTDANVTDHDGFRLRYKAVHPKYCSGVSQISEPQGSFSDGSEEFNYSNSSVCQYFINPPNASKLTINFDSFNLGEGDAVIIYETNPSHLIANLNSESNPTSFVSNTGSMMIMFRTDAMFNGEGFEISYEIENINTEEVDSFSSFELYPNPTSDVLTMNMRIDNENQANINIYNIDGMLLSSESLKNPTGTFYKEFDVSYLNPGVYLMVIETTEGKITKRFIVK